MRHTILAELGRIDDEQAREAMALYLQHKPTTRQAVALIRQYRLGTRPQGAPQLAAVIQRAIATYQAQTQHLNHEPPTA